MIDDLEDVKLLHDVMSSYTLTSKLAQHAMLDALRQITDTGVDGDVVECGVWRGGNIILARTLVPERTCWLYDTFSGMTLPGPEDLRRSGDKALDTYHACARDGRPWCMSSLNDVVQNFMDTGTFSEDLCRFIVGDVVETLRIAKNLPEKISLLRLDTDWYASTKTELEVLYPRLSIGGVLIVDDYGHWQGAKKAVDEFLGAKVADLVQVDYSVVRMTKTC